MPQTAALRQCVLQRTGGAIRRRVRDYLGGSHPKGRRSPLAELELLEDPFATHLQQICACTCCCRHAVAQGHATVHASYSVDLCLQVSVAGLVSPSASLNAMYLTRHLPHSPHALLDDWSMEEDRVVAAAADAAWLEEDTPGVTEFATSLWPAVEHRLTVSFGQGSAPAAGADVQVSVLLQDRTCEALASRFARCLKGAAPGSVLTLHLQQPPWPQRAKAMGEHPMHPVLCLSARNRSPTAMFSLSGCHAHPS